METLVLVFLILLVITSFSFFIYKKLSVTYYVLNFENKKIKFVINNFTKIQLSQEEIDREIIEGIRVLEACNISKSAEYLDGTEIEFVDFPISYLGRKLAGLTSFGASCKITVAVGGRIANLSSSAFIHELGHVILYKDTNSTNQDMHHTFFRDHKLSI